MKVQDESSGRELGPSRPLFLSFFWPKADAGIASHQARDSTSSHFADSHG